MRNAIYCSRSRVYWEQTRKSHDTYYFIETESWYCMCVCGLCWQIVFWMCANVRFDGAYFYSVELVALVLHCTVMGIWIARFYISKKWCIWTQMNLIVNDFYYNCCLYIFSDWSADQLRWYFIRLFICMAIFAMCKIIRAWCECLGTKSTPIENFTGVLSSHVLRQFQPSTKLSLANGAFVLADFQVNVAHVCGERTVRRAFFAANWAQMLALITVPTLVAAQCLYIFIPVMINWEINFWFW